MITVATWNVLHRIHAENWGEDVATHWPDESKRVAAIAGRVAELPAEVVALQEVSGDLLAAIRATTGRTVHAMRYRRVPRPRKMPSQLKDDTEYLVLLVDGPSRVITELQFHDDWGKGGLAVHTAGLTMVATHVSWWEAKRAGQLAKLRDLAVEPAVLMGDFNADGDTVVSGLGEGFRVAELPPGATTQGEQAIDHVIVRGATATNARVLDNEGLSDHHPVLATIS
ncbi:endonuclease/exonuclease/phosphatase family protein [Kutzneria sp. CA-103260]|uniref:endonuclease/exonuclease/phosphatase family protein n=1 Tax=Kutzneria sp. CA-103260 TaxID=2802641 RepID=UPI001BA73B51|nr:endonuclease/exonuclease/phosphatase family protein [Kutzneria sp. CA-103260]QUQ65970.1 Endonuclease/Exonuclease/phosphatase family protein [Kutzneria sp. CA-103260]